MYCNRNFYEPVSHQTQNASAHVLPQPSQELYKVAALRGRSVYGAALAPCALFGRERRRAFGVAQSFMASLPCCRNENKIVVVSSLCPSHFFLGRPATVPALSWSCWTLKI